MKVTAVLIKRLINEAYGDLVKPGPFGDWLKRLGALDDHPEFDQETWNKLGNMLTHEEESHRDQGRAILESFGFDDWDWLQDVLDSWDRAGAAIDLKNFNLEPGDPMYSITHDMGSYGDDISRMATQGDAVEYLSKLTKNLRPLEKKYNLHIPQIEGWMGTSSDPTAYVMLKRPYIGIQIVHWGGASGPARIYPFGWEDKNTTNEFIDWFINNFEESELTGDIDRDTKHVTDVIHKFRKYATLNSQRKQMLFLKKPEWASKFLDAKTAIGLEE